MNAMPFQIMDANRTPAAQEIERLLEINSELAEACREWIAYLDGIPSDPQIDASEEAELLDNMRAALAKAEATR